MVFIPTEHQASRHDRRQEDRHGHQINLVDFRALHRCSVWNSGKTSCVLKLLVFGKTREDTHGTCVRFGVGDSKLELSERRTRFRDRGVLYPLKAEFAAASSDRIIDGREMVCA